MGDVTIDQIPLVNEMSASAQTIQYLMVAHTDEQVISQFKEITVNCKIVQFYAAKFQDFCHMFTQDYIFNFLATQGEQ